MPKKNLWFKFYPQDWRGDEVLKSCSLAARGLWIEMLGYMHAAEDRGFLYIAGNPVSIEELALFIGRPVDEVEAAFNELAEKKVFSFSVRKGVKIPFSRKMVKGEKKARTARANGQSGGNPSLLNQTENSASDNQSGTNADNQEIANGDNRNEGVGVKPQIPEARSQIPESKKDISSPPSSSSRDERGGRGLEDRVFEILGFDGSQSPNWITLGLTLDKLTGMGCTEAHIIAAAENARASRDGKGPPSTPAYLEPIALRIRDEHQRPARDRSGEAMSSDAPMPQEQPWAVLRAELSIAGDPKSIRKRDKLKAAFRNGGDDEANELAAQMQQKEAV